MPAGCRICSKARQSRVNRQSAPHRQSRPLRQTRRRGETGRLAKAPGCKACRARKQAACKAFHFKAGLPRSKPVAPTCEPAKFRIVVDVGHTAQSEGAISARNVSEFVYNLRLAQRIEEKLKAEGFTRRSCF